MTDHLPECLHDDRTYGLHGLCICDRLRACEQRVRNQDIATHHADLQEAKALLASRDEAWYAGVDAAREAVESSARREWVNTQSALAAIDALREKP